MGFKRSTTDIKVHQSLGDTPNVDNGITAEDLKKRYDFPAETIQNDLNALMGELEETTGASNIGAEPLEDGDTSGNTIKDKLIELKNRIANAMLGQIPNGTITKEKLNTDFSNLIAEKDGELQKNLNAEMLGGQRLEQFTKVVVGTYVGDGATTDRVIDIGYEPRAVIISSNELVQEYDNDYYNRCFPIIITSVGFTEGYDTNNYNFRGTHKLTSSGFVLASIARNSENKSASSFNSNNHIYSYIAII